MYFQSPRLVKEQYNPQTATRQRQAPHASILPGSPSERAVAQVNKWACHLPKRTIDSQQGLLVIRSALPEASEQGNGYFAGPSTTSSFRLSGSDMCHHLCALPYTPERRHSSV